MKKYTVKISNKESIFDPVAEEIKSGIEELGINGIEKVYVIHLYIIEGNINRRKIEFLARELLTDPITQEFSLNGQKNVGNLSFVVEVLYKAGVTDAVGESVVKACQDMGIKGIKGVRTGKEYILICNDNIKSTDMELISSRLLANAVIQTYKIYRCKR